MKILITGTTGDSMPPPYGGIPKVILLYGREWVKMGHEVAITFVYRPEKYDDFNAGAKYYFEYKSKPNKLKKIGFLLKYFLKNPFLYFSLFFKRFSLYDKLSVELVLYSAYGVYINGVVSDFQPDIILSEAALIKTFMVACLANSHNIPLVIDTYAEVKDPLMGVNKHLDEVQKEKYWTSFLDRADLVLGISNCTVGAQRYLPPEKVIEFYDTCDFSLFKEKIEKTKKELRQDLNLPENMFLVGAVGAFEFRKGHDQLIKSAAILNKKGLNVGVAICGGSGDSTKWKDLAKEECIENKVFFFSRLSEKDLLKFYKSLDAYSNLSNSERSCGLDLALLEGMAAELPIVVYNNGGLSKAVDQNKNGFVVETGNLNEVAEVLGKMYVMSSEERLKMGKESASIASKCDIELTSKIKADWLQNIINKRK